MKYKNTIQIILGMFCSVLAGCSTAENNINDTNLEKNKKSNQVILSLKCEYDITQFYNNLEELSDAAEVIIRCKVLERKSYVPVGGSIYTDYQLGIEEVYKGEPIVPQDEITLEALGGEMDGGEYLEQSNFENKLKKSGYSREEFVNGKVEMLVYDIPLLEIGKTYVIYAAYNQTKQKYYAVGTNQGIFMEEYQDKFTRQVPKAHISVGESIMYTVGLDEIKDSCQ